MDEIDWAMIAGLGMAICIYAGYLAYLFHTAPAIN